MADVQIWVPEPRSYDLVLVAYLHLPEQQRRSVMRAAAEAVATGGTLLVVGHDLENLTSGHGGPQDPAVLYRPSDIAQDIEPADLIVGRSETVRRSLTDGPGQRRRHSTPSFSPAAPLAEPRQAVGWRTDLVREGEQEPGSEETSNRREPS